MCRLSGGTFDYESKRERLQEVSKELEDPVIWNKPERAQELGRERARLEELVGMLDKLTGGLDDSHELLNLAVEEGDGASVGEVGSEVVTLEKQVAQLEFQRMFSGKMDSHNAFLDVQSGSGGTEAQDWANMLLRMYLRWGERRGFKVELMEVSAGEVAGVKSATVRFEGPYAFGWLRTETGVHRLVRKSPFDSGNRRHTSFASIFVSPEVDDDIQIEINPADLKVDTYRSSGAGGQHVNKTESAVRIVHIPTGIVVASQQERSQAQNREVAMTILRAKLVLRAAEERDAKMNELRGERQANEWGSQIRSYVLQPYQLVKDHRTNVDVGDAQRVLDGDIDAFIWPYLQQRRTPAKA